MAYLKICIICTTSFPCKRATALFCSDPCRNKGRSMKPELKLALIRRNGQYIMKANNYLAEVPDKNGTLTAIGYTPENADNKHPLGEDEAYLIALAKMEKQKRDELSKYEEKEKQKSLESESGFSVVESPADMSTEALQAGATAEIINIEPKKYKIRPINNSESKSGFSE
jgi:hypothetical protein